MYRMTTQMPITQMYSAPSAFSCCIRCRSATSVCVLRFASVSEYLICGDLYRCMNRRHTQIATTIPIATGICPSLLVCRGVIRCCCWWEMLVCLGCGERVRWPRTQVSLFIHVLVGASRVVLYQWRWRRLFQLDRIHRQTAEQSRSLVEVIGQIVRFCSFAVGEDDAYTGRRHRWSDDVWGTAAV